MESRIRLVRLFFCSSSAILLVLILLLGLFLGWQEYRDLRTETQRITNDRLASGRELIRRQVLRTSSFLEYQQSLTRQRLENDLRERVLAATAVAARLYAIYGKTLSKPELASLIIETLRPMRFNGGRGRFFIIDRNGVNRLEDDFFVGENRGLIDLVDADHHFIVRDLIRIARDNGEGFYSCTGAKTDAAAGDGRRIVYVKYLEPLNFIIGAGESRGVVDYELQKEALAQLQHIRYDDDGYIFVLRPDGVVLSHPDRHLIGKNLLNDSNVRVRDAIARLIKAGEQRDGGETRYLWPKPSGGQPVSKLGYTRTFAPWGWIVGTGIYLDDIDREIAAATAGYRGALRDEMVSGALLFSGFILLSLLLYRFIAGRLDTELDSLTGFLNRAAVSHEKIDSRKLKFREFAKIGASANRMLSDFLEIQKDLQNRIDFENLVMTISTRFNNCMPERLDREIERALSDILKITGMARGYLFEFRDGNARMDNTHEWCAQGVEPHRHRLQDLRVADFPTIKKNILNGKAVQISDVADLPPESAEEKREFEREGIRSLALVPTVSAGCVTGFLGLDATKPVSKWPDETVALLRIAGEIIAGGLERRRAEARIKEIEQIIESTPAVAFRWKNAPGWPVDVVSQNVEKVFGFTAQEFLSGRILYDHVIHPEDLERVNRELAGYSLHPSREEFAQEYRIITADGRIRWVDDRTYIRRDPQGHITHYQGVVVDINDLKQLETAHRDLEKQYQQAQKMEALGRLSGGVAHDFNNLLTVILGYTEILNKKIDRDHPHYAGLEQIQEAALKARDLTNHLLAFGRKQPMRMAVIDINESLSAFCKMLRRVIGDNIELHFSSFSEALHVMADLNQIDQVMMNLAVNARDAMPEGGTLTIQTTGIVLDETFAERKADFVPGSYAMISVSDSGSGIDDAIKSVIFEPFFTTKDHEKGTGLGLAISYGIIKQHGGHISCYSEPGRGTTFKIYLPLVPDAPAGKQEPDPVETPAPIPATVLVIEDDPAVRHLTSSILSGAGYHVLEAGHPEKAARIARSTEDTIHLVVADVIMPGMMGPETYEEVLKHHPGARVLYMSGYTLGALAAQKISIQADRYLQKPFSAHLLLEQAAAALSVGRN